MLETSTNYCLRSSYWEESATENSNSWICVFVCETVTLESSKVAFKQEHCSSLCGNQWRPPKWEQAEAVNSEFNTAGNQSLLPEFGSFWFHFKQFSHRGTGHICRKFFCNRNERIMCLIPFFLFWFTLLFTVILLLSKGSPPYQSVAASWGSTPARPSPATSRCPCRWRQQATRKCPPWPLELQCPLLSPRPPRIS